VNEYERRAAQAGIHRIAVPTPFQVGRVNAYLIEDEPLTLVDSGPHSERSLAELEAGLATLGHRVEDLELLVISHQHMDHFGLAAALAERSGAEVAALDLLVPVLGDYEAFNDREEEFAQRVMLRHGIPDEMVDGLRAVLPAFRRWGQAVQITRPLREGDTLEFANRRLEVLHRPGHSPSDTVLYDRERGILIAADHLLAHISSNPVIALALPERGGAERTRSLVQYLDSLERTRELDLDIVLTGHGDPLGAHRELIDQRLRLHERRAAKIAGLVDERPRTAHEVALEMWGNIAVTQSYLTLSEVVGHADLLVRDGRTVETERDGVTVYESA
jgi:glyoxylase-like metal-dependent hydrolase (beta-lactamase superfamily II)